MHNECKSPVASHIWVDDNGASVAINGPTSEDEIEPGHKMVEYTYIVDFASVVGICLDVCDTAEAGEEPLRKRVE